jgi:hypothetical protein
MSDVMTVYVEGPTPNQHRVLHLPSNIPDVDLWARIANARRDMAAASAAPEEPVSIVHFSSGWVWVDGQEAHVDLGEDIELGGVFVCVGEDASVRIGPVGASKALRASLDVLHFANYAYLAVSRSGVETRDVVVQGNGQRPVFL